MSYKDLPAISESVDTAIKTPVRRIIEAVQTLLGFRGDRRDKAVLWGDLVDGGLATLGGVGGAGGGIIPLPGGGGGEDTGVDLTPPPTPTGLSATGGFAQIFLEVNAPTFTQGHGALKLNLYMVQKDRTDPTMPTFGDAALAYEVPAPRTVASFPSNLYTRWHIWAKWQTVDGVESTDPAGGLNGVIAQTGKIGNVDLGDLIIEAENLAAGSVTGTALADKVVNAAKLGDGAVTARTLVITDFQNLCSNGMGLNLDGWTISAGFLPSRVYVQPDPTYLSVAASGFSPVWGPAGVASDSAFYTANRDVFFGPAFEVKPGETFLCGANTVPRGGGVGNFNCGVSVAFFDAVGNATGYNMGAQRNAGLAGVVGISGIATAPPGTAWGLVWIQINADPAATDLRLNGNSFHFTNIRVLKRNAGQLIVDGGITANHLAANSIAVGSAAIENGAIRNALIGDASVDDAKIANLSAAKLTVGDGTVGGNLKSSNYASGSTGWQVQPNGFAEFSNIVVRGVVYATSGAFSGTITAGAGYIGGVAIGGTNLSSTNYASGTTGFRINADGSVECNNLTAAGNITANSLNAATGTLGALTLSATGYIRGGQTSYGVGIGVFMGYSGGAYKLFVGNPAGSWLAFDGTSLMLSQPIFDSFTASIAGGDLVVGASFPYLAPGTQTYGSRTVSASGGRPPYSVTWFLNLGYSSSSSYPLSQCWISAGTSQSATVTIAGTGDSMVNVARAICLVQDANGRVTSASFHISAKHASGTVGGGGGDAP